MTEQDLPDGVHVLPLTMTFEGQDVVLNPSAIETERGLLLVDTGTPDTVEQLEARLEEVGYALSDVASVLVTHQDGDHAGGLATVVQRANPFVVAHERAGPVVDGRDSTRGPGDDRYPPARVDLELGGTATFSTRAGPARVVPTPGHTPGHVSMYLPEERLLLAADALTADEDGLQGPRPDMSRHMGEALRSVARLAELDVERTLCYHGGFVDEGSDRIAEIGTDDHAPG
jgi:glyoxylase-like metal-dependent hydrolase (beta-lactamase superfamily II)